MAVTISGPLTVLCAPDQRLTPSSIVAGPSGGLATYTESQLDWDVTRDAGNYASISGLRGAEPVVSGLSSTSSSIGLDVQTPGIPSRTAEYTYTVANQTYGANKPYVFGGVYTAKGATSGDGYQNPTTAAAPDGRVYIAYEDWVNDAVRCLYIDPDTGMPAGDGEVWAASVTTFGTSDYFANPAIEVVRSDSALGYSLFIFAWDVPEASGTQVLRVSRSDDGGSNWIHYYTDLEESYGVTSWDQMGVKWDPLGQQWTMVTLHYGATDYGKTFISNHVDGASWSEIVSARIENASDVSIGYYRCGNNGVFHMLVQTTANANIASYSRVASLSGWDTLSANIGATANGGMSLAISDAGWLYSTHRLSTDGDKLVMMLSTRGGYDWGKPLGRYPFETSGQLVVLDDDVDGTSTTLGNGIVVRDATWVGETMYVVGTLITSATTIDNSIVYAKFGGLSTVTASENPSGTDAPYYPSVIPETKSPQYQSFVTSGSTAQSFALDSDSLLVYRLSNDNSTGYDDYRVISDPSVAATHWIIGVDTAGGSTSSDAIALWLKCHDDGNANNYGLAVRINATTRKIQAYDLVGAANKGSETDYTAGAPLEILAALDGENGVAAVYYRMYGTIPWVEIISNESLSSTGGGLNTAVLFGKLAASTANIDTIGLIPFGSSSSGYVSRIAAGNFSLTTINATTTPQRIHTGQFVRWNGSPLHGGDGWDADTLSRQPIQLISPLCSTPSPTSQYVGTSGAAGGTYRIVFDFQGWLSTHLAYVGFANCTPLASIQLQRWGGSSYSTEINADLAKRPFGNDGAVGFARDSGTSFRFRASASNGIPYARYAQDLQDAVVYISDGTNTIIGPVLKVHPGNFTSSGTALRLSFELDPDNYTVVAGSFASLSTSTSGGTVRIYPTDGVVIGTQTSEVDDYLAISFTLAPGYTTPKIGHLSAGAAHILGRTVRDGASIRFTAPDSVRELEGNIIARGRKKSRRRIRTFDLPFDTILTQPGRYADGTEWRATTLSSTVMGGADDNLDVVEHLHYYIGQRSPMWLLPSHDFGGVDPNSTAAVIHGDRAILGVLPAEFDRTQSRGLLFTDGRYHTQGGRIFFREMI